MSWIQKLYETYNNCESAVGYSTEENKRPLLPICHITAQADIEITLDENGNFITANLITNPKDATTIIPSTENSASRSGKKPECHPFSDSLQYLAGDFENYGGNVTSGFVKNPQEPYNNFIKSLTDWCESEFNHPKVKAVLNYVKKKSLITDLVDKKILFVGTDGKLLQKRESKKDKKAPPDIFDIAGSQDKALIRWIVAKPGDLETKAWKDKSLWESWGKFYLSTKNKEPVCFVTGEKALIASLHPKYIRFKGDGAKIISANDTSDFTFRGRFLNDKEAKKKKFPPNQVCGVSLEVTQKAHNALIWLIGRQGYKGKDGQTIVAWATSGVEIPQPTDDPLDILGFNELPSNESENVTTAQELAIKLKKKISGYNKDLGDTTGVVVMGLDSATPGRMSITFYKELTGSDFLNRLDSWHDSCLWIHKYGFDRESKRHFTFVGAPAPVDIAEAAYGSKADDKIKKTTVARLLPCIIDGQSIPHDIVESAVRRACNRVAMEDWEWNKTLSIACSLFKKYSKEKYNMSYDPNRTTRDYLYGCLLAIADKLEGHALSKTNEKRETNAARYMQIFAEHPFKTWRQIELALSPYKARLGGAHYYTGLIDEVMSKFAPEDFNNDKALSGEFLLGYHCQRAELWKEKGKEEIEDEE